MESALLYTFSTIAQALGEPFALLAAFVLYRFQTLNTLLWDDSAQVRGGLARAGGSLEAYDKLRTEGQFRELLVEIGSISARPSNFVMNDSEAVDLARFKKSIEQRAGFRNAFTRGAWATGVTMFFSVAAIPVAQYAYCMGACAWLLLVAGILGFGVCLLNVLGYHQGRAVLGCVGIEASPDYLNSTLRGFDKRPPI